MGQTKPTAKQLRYLRTLAYKTGQTFAIPATSQEASREIRRLRGVKGNGSSFAELETEFQPTSDPRLQPSSSYHRFEIRGYGSNCRWSH